MASNAITNSSVAFRTFKTYRKGYLGKSEREITVNILYAVKLQAVILATNQKYNVRFDDFIGFLYEKHCMDGSKSLELLRPFDG